MSSRATSSVHLVEASASERVVSTLVMAFGADPLFRWMWPDADAYLRNFPRLVRAFGGRAFDSRTAHASEDFEGAALWLPVGVEPDRSSLDALFEETLQDPVRTEAFAVLEQMDLHHPKDPCWHLGVIGVDVAHQNKGLGSRVLRKGLEACDAQGLLAYLESSNPANLPFYERHGFEVIAELQSGASPTVRAMARAAR